MSVSSITVYVLGHELCPDMLNPTVVSSGRLNQQSKNSPSRVLRLDRLH